jgi:putative RecB family exonuclease
MNTAIIAAPPPPNAVEQKARSIDDLLASVSASRLACFQQCRLKFYFRYVLGLEKPRTPALHVGSTVHSVLKALNKAKWRNEHLSLKQLHDIYSSTWALQEDGEIEWQDNDEAEQKQMGFKLIETYLRESPIKEDEKPEAVEVSVEADLMHHGLPNLIGIIDLVRPGGRIVDFKTSSKTPNIEMAPHLTDTQTSAYAVLYREATGKKESGIELHHLVKTKSPKLVVTPLDPMTELQQTRLFHIIESYVGGVENKDWIPSPGFHCSSCEFFNECRAWC